MECVSKKACSSDEINCFIVITGLAATTVTILVTASRVAIRLLSNFIRSSHLPLDLHSGLSCLSLPTCIHFSFIRPHTQPILLDFITLLTSVEHIMMLLPVQASRCPFSLTPSISHSTLFSNTLDTRSSTCVNLYHTYKVQCITNQCILYPFLYLQ